MQEKEKSCKPKGLEGAFVLSFFSLLQEITFQYYLCYNIYVIIKDTRPVPSSKSVSYNNDLESCSHSMKRNCFGGVYGGTDLI